MIYFLVKCHNKAFDDIQVKTVIMNFLKNAKDRKSGRSENEHENKENEGEGDRENYESQNNEKEDEENEEGREMLIDEEAF